VASQQPADPHNYSSYNSFLINGFQEISAAGRFKSAPSPQPGRDQLLISLYRKTKDFLHVSILHQSCFAKGFFQALFETFEGLAFHARKNLNNEIAGKMEPAFLSSKIFTNPSLDSISIDGLPEISFRNSDAKSYGSRFLPGPANDLKCSVSEEPPAFQRCFKIRAAGEAVTFLKSAVRNRQTVNRFLPFFLRLLSTRRPPRVAMRERNPCFRFRLIFDGWYVLFILRHPFCLLKDFVIFGGPDRRPSRRVPALPLTEKPRTQPEPKT